MMVSVIRLNYMMVSDTTKRHDGKGSRTKAPRTKAPRTKAPSTKALRTKAPRTKAPADKSLKIKKNNLGERPKKRVRKATILKF